MEEANIKLKLLAVLTTTKEFLHRSQHEGWPDEEPREAVAEIDKIISIVLESEENQLPEYASIMYAPTGSIQEIAISNGWHGVYMILADEFDRIINIINEDRK